MWCMTFFSIYFAQICLFFIILVFLADMQISRYVSPVGQVMETNNQNDQKITPKYFDFYLHTKANVTTGYSLVIRRSKLWKKRVFFSHQKKQTLKELEDGRKGCTLKRTKFTLDNINITLGNFFFSPTELSFKKLKHVLIYSSI